MAARPRTLPAAIAPVLVGSAAAGCFFSGALGLWTSVLAPRRVEGFLPHLEATLPPGVVLDFADGRVRLVGIRARKGGLLVSQKLAALKEHHPNTEARVVAIAAYAQELDPQRQIDGAR